MVKWGYLKQIKVQKLEEMTQSVKNSRRAHTWIKMGVVLAVLSKVFNVFDEQRKYAQHQVFRNLQAAKIQRAFKRYLLRCTKKCRLARNCLVVTSQAMCFINPKAESTLTKFLLVYSKIINLRYRIVHLVQGVASIQLKWRANQHSKRNVCSSLRQLFLRERDAMVLYLINSKSKKNSKKLLSQLQTLPLPIIETIVGQYIKMCISAFKVKCFLNLMLQQTQNMTQMRNECLKSNKMLTHFCNMA